MKLFTKAITEKLAKNGQVEDGDHAPVVKIFDPWSPCIWLLTESEPDAPNILFGLADLGFQCPEMGSVYRSELETQRNPLGLPLERDQHFTSNVPLSEWARVSSRIGYIPRSEFELKGEAEKLNIELSP